VALALALAVVVEGAATCPTPSLVAERLAPLLPSVSATIERSAADVARVESRRGALDIELRDPQGALRASRRLDEDAPCADLAAAAAVVLAAWEAELQPGAAPPPSLPPLALPPPRRLHFDLAVGALVALALPSGGSSFGALVEGGLAGRSGRGRGPGARVALAVPLFGAEEVALGSGSASFARRALSLGPRWRFAPGFFRLDLHANLAVAWVSVEGERVPGARRDDAAALGLDAGARAGLDLGPAIVWAEASLLWYPARERAVVDGSTLAADLPPVELLLAVGVALGSGR